MEHFRTAAERPSQTYQVPSTRTCYCLNYVAVQLALHTLLTMSYIDYIPQHLHMTTLLSHTGSNH